MSETLTLYGLEAIAFEKDLRLHKDLDDFLPVSNLPGIGLAKILRYIPRLVVGQMQTLVEYERYE